VAPDLVQEELQRICRRRQRSRDRRVLAIVVIGLAVEDGDAPSLELVAELLELGVVEVVLGCDCLELRLGDAVTLLGILDEGLERGDLVQGAQREYLPSSVAMMSARSSAGSQPARKIAPDF
jgi:hypothetical protein